MSMVRCEVTGPLAIGGVKRPGTVELDDEQVNVRALERAGHIRRAPAPSLDPTEHTVDEVNAYLAEASEAEQRRVLAAEVGGKNRKGIVGEE